MARTAKSKRKPISTRRKRKPISTRRSKSDRSIQSRDSSERLAPADLTVVGAPRKLKNDRTTIAVIVACGNRQFGVDVTASFLGVAPMTLRTFMFKTYPAIGEAFHLAQDQGKAMLRGFQWNSAAKGNIAMQIWLGKQYLGQRDKTDVNPNLPNATNPDAALDKINDLLAGEAAGGEAPPDSKRLN